MPLLSLGVGGPCHLIKSTTYIPSVLTSVLVRCGWLGDRYLHPACQLLIAKKRKKAVHGAT